MTDSKNFTSLHVTAEYLSAELSNELSKQIADRGKAMLIMPGGKSIIKFFPYISKMNILWDKLTIALSDERCVPIDHDMSNEKQLRNLFLNNLPTFNYSPITEDIVVMMQNNSPITVLSMGMDGHVASLFPEEAAEWKKIGLQNYKTKKQDPARISLSEAAFLLSKKIYILIIGKQKNEYLTDDILSKSPLNTVYNKAVIVRCLNA